jgi:hypothetical protein
MTKSVYFKPLFNFTKIGLVWFEQFNFVLIAGTFLFIHQLRVILQFHLNELIIGI